MTQICFGKVKGRGVVFPTAGNQLGLLRSFYEKQHIASGSCVPWTEITICLLHENTDMPVSSWLFHKEQLNGVEFIV